VSPDDLDGRLHDLGGGLIRVRAGDGEVQLASVSPAAGMDRRAPPRVEVVVDGWRFELEVDDERRALLKQRARRDHEHGPTGGPAEIRAIIPGRVVAVAVAPGDEIAIGDRLFVLEAMKMQNELRAHRAGRVSRIAVGEGQTVEAGDLLIVVE
jgi:biotin carboxyl carrier protein